MAGSLYAAMNDMPKSTRGNSSWAEAYGRTMKQLVKDRSARADRSMQRHLGPSELGEICDRQVIGKMAATAKTNNVSDPWASVMGTAGHAWVEDMYKWDNQRRVAEGMPARWIPEMKVVPDPGEDPHPGTADLYDADWKALVDHKFLGDTSRNKLIAKGPKRVYYVQLLLYRRGYQNLGLPVDRIVLLAWPRTKSSLDELYVWEHTPTPEDEVLVDQVIEQTKQRQEVAKLVQAGQLSIMDVKPTPSDDSCMFCPLYRPQAAYDPNTYGCPGTLMLKR
jgi:hypothetical protein